MARVGLHAFGSEISPPPLLYQLAHTYLHLDMTHCSEKEESCNTDGRGLDVVGLNIYNRRRGKLQGTHVHTRISVSGTAGDVM